MIREMLILGITILVYVVASLAPSSPLEILFNDPYATAEEMARKSKELGLDQPVIIQYIRWLVQLVQGNMGMSIRTNGQVLDMILERIGPTLILTGSAMALTLSLPCLWESCRLISPTQAGIIFPPDCHLSGPPCRISSRDWC